MLTADRLRELLCYDPISGLFTNRITRSSRAKKDQVAGTPNTDGHIQISIDNKLYYAHRLAWLYINGEWPPGKIDHKDTKPSNNEWENLRLANKSQNAANTKTSRFNKTGYKGVSWCKKRKSYIARIKVNGKCMFLGSFKTIPEASAAYRAAAIIAFGEFARYE